MAFISSFYSVLNLHEKLAPLGFSYKAKKSNRIGTKINWLGLAVSMRTGFF